jgi:hypothetical protein
VIESATIFGAYIFGFSARWLIVRRSLYPTTVKTPRRRNLLPRFWLLLMISKKHDNNRPCKFSVHMQTMLFKALPFFLWFPTFELLKQKNCRCANNLGEANTQLPWFHGRNLQCS